MTRARANLRDVAGGSPDAPIGDMATTAQFPDLHTPAASRWLAGFLPIFLFVVAMGLIMLAYPYVTG